MLTGFTNFLSVGIFLGGYGELAPNRKTDMARIAIRGLIAATLACMVTACVAGKLTHCVLKGLVTPELHHDYSDAISGVIITINDCNE